MKSNFIENSKMMIVDLNSRQLLNKLIRLFLKNNSIVYITNNKQYYGIIRYEKFIENNFNVFSSIEKNYPTILFDGTENIQLEKILLKNDKIKNIPVCDKKNTLIYEYRKKDTNTEPLSINKKRWCELYQNNLKFIDILNLNKYKKINIVGNLNLILKKYIEENSKIKCTIYNESIDSIINKKNEKNMIIIDTDNSPKELTNYITNIEKYVNGRNIIIKSINELCDESELYYFSKFIKSNNLRTYFFLCQTPEQLTNLNFYEKLRIKFDKHYRYYLENMNKNEDINKIVKKVLGDLYTPEFIESRNHMSGTILKNGICFLAPTTNQYCRVLKGLRYTTNHDYETNYKINMFGPCIFFGPLQDDERTISSYLQRLVNLNKKDYWVYNYGQRAISMYENIRTAMSIDINEEDILVFAISPEENLKLLEYGINNIYPIVDLFNSEPDFHDYFMGEPIHCNHIANEKIAKYIYNIISKSLLSINCDLRENKIINKQKSIDVFKNNKELKKYIKELKKTYPVNNCDVGAIMMNCNPFTKGHYNLVKYASNRVDKLFVFVVQEDKSYFKFIDRIEMVKKGCEEFKNVFVVGSGTVFGSYITFPDYFHRDDNPDVEIDVSMDIELFTNYIAPALNIKKRFVGEEPIDNVTRNYNNQIKKELPKFNIEFIEIPRFTDNDGNIISAKHVRKAIECDDWEKVKKLVPDSVIQILEKYRKKI